MPASLAHMVIAHKAMDRLKERGFAELAAFAATIEGDALSHLVSRHLKPTPRLTLGWELARGGLASSMIDVSDGVLRDAGNLARQSKVSMVVDTRRVRVSKELEEGAALLGMDPMKLALGGGEDYELLFTAPSSNREPIELAAGRLGLTLTAIGRVVPGKGVRVLGAEGEEVPMPELGFDHFT